MVDSTNPRIMADNIKELAASSGGSSVEANPSGEATTVLDKLGIDGTNYLIRGGFAITSSEVVTGIKFGTDSVKAVLVSGLNVTLTSNASSWIDTEISAANVSAVILAIAIDSSNCSIPVAGAVLSANNTIGIYSKIFGDRDIKQLILFYI